MKKEDFKVGQTVYILQILNFRNDATIEERIREVKVLSVGRKYVTVDFWGQMKFDATKDFREATHYSPSYQLYLSKEQILQEFHRYSMQQTVMCAFDWSSGITRNMSQEDLQTVFDIVKKYRGDEQ